MSGAMPLSALAPHVRRFGLHPLQTFRRDGGPSSSTARRRRSRPKPTRPERVPGGWPDRLGFVRSIWTRIERVLYHAGATMASNFLVTLYRASRQLVEAAGAPPEAWSR